MTQPRRTDDVSDAESRKRAIDEQLSHARRVFTKLARGEYGGAPQPSHGSAVPLPGAGTLLPSPRAILVEERRWHQKAMSLQRRPGLSVSNSTPNLFGDDASSLREPSVVRVLASSLLRRAHVRVSVPPVEQGVGHLSRMRDGCGMSSPTEGPSDG